MNLIYCTSPLQALIAERIIDLYPNEQFYCVFDFPEKIVSSALRWII